jgi:cell cycle checkpoint control protein RAD9A
MVLIPISVSGMKDAPYEADSVLGVIKTSKLTYEPIMAQHALFDNTKTQNQWIADAKFLREITEHFAPAAEQLDISSENGKALFTNFTAKVSYGNGMMILDG